MVAVFASTDLFAIRFDVFLVIVNIGFKRSNLVITNKAIDGNTATTTVV